MVDLILAAIPFFIVLLGAEFLSFRHLAHEHDEAVGYAARDTATSLSMGLGNVAVNAVWKIVAVAAFAAAYQLTPLRLPDDSVWSWVVLLVVYDFLYYWYHRSHHQVRLLWASHVVHHSSRHFNLSTALRQTWTPMTALPFFIPLALLGFPPWIILVANSVDLLYQFGLHTERIHTLPRAVEWLWNTPSHHRVHHGSQAEYLDRNHGGMLIVWDRLFGTFEPEGRRVEYGLTRNIETHNPLDVAFGEYRSIWRDIRRARNWSARAGHALRAPGWQPAVEDPPPAPAAAPLGQPSAG